MFLQPGLETSRTGLLYYWVASILVILLFSLCSLSMNKPAKGHHRIISFTLIQSIYPLLSLLLWSPMLTAWGVLAYWRVWMAAALFLCSLMFIFMFLCSLMFIASSSVVYWVIGEFSAQIVGCACSNHKCIAMFNFIKIWEKWLMGPAKYVVIFKDFIRLVSCLFHIELIYNSLDILWAVRRREQVSGDVTGQHFLFYFEVRKETSGLFDAD